MATFVGGTYYGGDTDDSITGTSGNDTLYGGGGQDVISGGDGDDLLVGENGADVIDGGAGNDFIHGGSTSSSFDYDHGIDKLTGGAGADTFRMQFGFSEVTGNLNEIDHITDFSAAEGDRLHLVGYSFDGRLAWSGAITDAAFSLEVGKTLGGDTPVGYAGLYTWTSGSTTYLIADVDGDHKLSAKDFAVAFDNRPTLTVADIIQLGALYQFGSVGADVWTGTSDNDIYYGREGADQANGGLGKDELHGGDGDDRLEGGDGDDILIGEAGSDTLYGGAGADTLYAGARYNGFNDTVSSKNALYGGDGDDILIGSDGVDQLDGGAGADSLTGGSGDTLVGGEGNDGLLASGTAVADGGAGDDRLIDGGGASRLTGGAGADTFSLMAYRSSNTPWTVIGYTTITDFNPNEGDKALLSARTINPIVFRGAVDAGFSLQAGTAFSAKDYGPGFSQVWTWTSGADTFLLVDYDGDGKLSEADYVAKFAGVAGLTSAQAQADPQVPNFGYLVPGGTDGADVFLGGDAVDTYYGLSGDDEIHGGGGNYDYLHGNGGADRIYGDAGLDWIYGGAGDDYIDGGADNDTIYGGAGADTIYGGDGDDYIQASGGEGDDYDAPGVVNLVYGGAGRDNISGAGKLYGGDGADNIFGSGELYGDDGDDYVTAGGTAIVHGGAGDDNVNSSFGDGVQLYGDAGKDRFQGGEGADLLYVELGDLSAFAAGGDDRIYLSNTRAGETAVLTSVGGGTGDDVFLIQGPLDTTLTLDGGDGADTLDLGLSTVAVSVNLSTTSSQNTGFGGFTLVSVENVIGGDKGATLTGGASANSLRGGLAHDVLSGGGGADILTGGGADDALDGGGGLDTAVYSGAAKDYAVTRSADGVWTVKDLRASAADGVDTLSSVEALRFSDKTVSLPQLFVTALLRGGGAIKGSDLEAKIAAGTSTLDSAIVDVVKAAGATTSVASLAYEFFTGKVPGEAGIDFLVSPTGPNPTNLNSAYYAQFNTVNRYINFAVNLGKNGEGKDAFAAKYGSLSLFDATKEAYKTIFGATPTDAKVHALIDTRVDYLASYGGDGASGIGTKAAMVGFLLAAAATEDVGVMAKSNDAWLTDLADGSAPFAIDILDPAKGYYKADFIFGG